MKESEIKVGTKVKMHPGDKELYKITAITNGGNAVMEEVGRTSNEWIAFKSTLLKNTVMVVRAKR